MKKYKPTEAETKKAFCDFIEKTLEMIGLKDKITEIRLDKYIKILGKKVFPDVSYRSMVVELEAYGSLTREPDYDLHTAFAIIQAIKYMFAEAESQRIPLTKIRGFVTDLKQLIAIRYIPITRTTEQIEELKSIVLNISKMQDISELETRSRILSRIKTFFNIKYYSLSQEPEALYGLEELVNAIIGHVKPMLNVNVLVNIFGVNEKNCLASKSAQFIVQTLYKTFIKQKEKDYRIKEAFEFWNQLFIGMAGYNLNALRGKKEWKCLYNAYGFKNEPSVKEFFFVLHTLVSLVAKLIAYEVISLANPILRSNLQIKPLSLFQNLKSNDLKTLMESVEFGRIFEDAGIHGFLMGDPFKWYLLAWNEEIVDIIKFIANELGRYDLAPLVINPWLHHDILKRLYQNIIPRKIRHDLGEYYTPDWLAQYLIFKIIRIKPKIIEEIIYDQGKAVDPACGSGTFLLEMIKLLSSKYVKELSQAPRQKRKDIAMKALRQITSKIIGFDINPVASIIAKINYLLALLPFLYEVYTSNIQPNIEIPIYISDTIVVPSLEILASTKKAQKNLTLDKWINVKHINGGLLVEIPRPFPIKIPVIKGSALRRLFEELRGRLPRGKKELQKDEIAKLVENSVKHAGLESVITNRQKTIIIDLVQQILKKNSIWLSILTDFFTPLSYTNKFTLVIGNPPWVNWVNIPDDYKKILSRIASYYGLKTGALGKATIDISAIMTYVAVDKFLKNDNGIIAFLITQSLFQSVAGSGFRRFLIGNKPISMELVEDLVDIRPFEGATNRTALFIAVKGLSTKYPIKYIKWKFKKEFMNKKLKKDIFEMTLEEVINVTERVMLEARPVIDTNPQSVWIILPPGQYNKLKKLFKRSPYTAHKGVNFSVVGAFWVMIKRKGSTNYSIVVKTYSPPRAKIEITPQEKEIEKSLVYPLIRGVDLEKWKSNIKIYTILPFETKIKTLDDKIIVEINEINSEKEMREKYSKTYEYLLKYKEAILRVKQEPYKSAFASGEKPFFWLFNAKPALHPFKVMWRYISKKSEISACAVSIINDPYVGLKPVVPYEKIVYVSVDTAEEAYYLAGILNSKFVNLLISSYTVETQRAPHILEKIFIPKFNKNNKLHKQIAELSMKIHELVKEGRNVANEEMELEKLIYQLYCSELNIDINILREFTKTISNY